MAEAKPRTERARRLRRQPTYAEAKLWKALRGAAPGAKWRRRHPVGPYVADFACVARKLLVEVDGGVHALRTVEDQLRTEALEAMGWCVLRVTDEAVLGDMGGVLERISQAFAAGEPSRSDL